jgi:hypothetical protein
LDIGLRVCYFEVIINPVLERSMTKRILASICIAALAIGITGCASGPETKRGAVAGSVLGGVVGGVIGHQSGRGLEGAAIGAGAGALGGGALGSAKDQEKGN